MINNASEYIIKKFNIDLEKESPFILNFNRLTDLPTLFKELEVRSGAEIGVAAGGFSEILCKNFPDAKIYSIDPWKFYPLVKNFKRQKQHDLLYRAAVEKLSKYPNSEIIKKTSMDAVKDFEDGSLDFVFIDADHRFQHITNDLAEWSKKVRIGGIISGHDYGEGVRSTDFVHTKYVVHTWTKCYKIHPWFVLDAPGEASWMWVKTRNFP